MSIFTHNELVDALGFTSHNKNPLWRPSDRNACDLLYLSLKNNGISGSEALRILVQSPDKILKILPLLNDTDLDDCRALAAVIAPMADFLIMSKDYIAVWCARQTVYRTLNEKGISI